MASTRPYLIMLNGRQRMIEGRGPEHIAHLVLGHLINARTATGQEVLEWTRSGKKIETSDDMEEPLTLEGLVIDKAVKDAVTDGVLAGTKALGEAILGTGLDLDALTAKGAECWKWLHATGCGSRASDAWHDSLGKGHLDVEAYDILRADNPAFQSLIVASMNSLEDEQAILEHDIQFTREQIMRQPIAIDDAVRLILKAAADA